MYNRIIIIVVVASQLFVKAETGIHSTTQSLIDLGQVDGKNYFYNRSTEGIGRNWTTAGNYCNEAGLVLATIETASQAEFLRAKANSTGFGGAEYWTGARDSQLPRQFTWNSTGTVPSDSIGIVWSYYEQNLDYQTCLIYYAHVYPPSFSLIPCFYEVLNVLCQTHVH